MLSQIEASNQWNYYQAKSIKAAVLDAKIAFTGASDESDQSKRARYEQEQQEVRSEAEHKQAAAKSYFHKHEVFARGVTMFQIAIAIAAISALTRKRSFWVVSLVFGAFGCAFLVARRDRLMIRDRVSPSAHDRRKPRLQLDEVLLATGAPTRTP